MAKVKIVTDSAAELTPALIRELGITVVPIPIRLDSDVLLDRVELSTQMLYKRMGSGRVKLVPLAPPVESYQQVFSRLGRQYDAILSIHASSGLSGSYRAALEAKRSVSERSQIIVIDSRLVSMAQGFLSMSAARAAQREMPLNEIAWLVRGMVLQTHLMFLVEDASRLKGPGAPPKGARGYWLSTLEDGVLTIVEEVPSRVKGIEKLYEFVELFPRIEELAVLYSTTLAEVEALVRRMEPYFPRERVIMCEYGPLLAAHFSLGALGVAVYEGRPGGE